MQEATQIYHSSFARYTLFRETVRVLAWNHGATCAWCGNVSRDAHGAARLFKYSRSPDDSGRIDYAKGEFCSVGCMRSYHSVEETP